MDTDIQILIVDDSRSMRRIIKTFLTRNGCTCITEARNGRDALECLNRQRIDLIISDLHMPGMDGMEFLRRIKDHTEFKEIPFVMLTVEAIQKTMNQALDMDIDSYIVKPVAEKAFMAELERVMRERNPGG